MGYLITQILLCLLVAFGLGALLGWLLGRRGDGDEECQRALEACRRDLDTCREALAAGRIEKTDFESRISALDAKIAAFAAVPEPTEPPSPEPELPEPPRPDRIKGTFYDIEIIEGIGPVYGEKLRAIEIHTTEDLLYRCADPAGRAATASELGFNEAILLTWTCIADLMRVPGIGEEYSELIEAAGARTVVELASCETESLLAKMTQINHSRNLTRQLPRLEQVQEWKQLASQTQGVVAF